MSLPSASCEGYPCIPLVMHTCARRNMRSTIWELTREKGGWGEGAFGSSVVLMSTARVCCMPGVCDVGVDPRVG